MDRPGTEPASGCAVVQCTTPWLSRRRRKGVGLRRLARGAAAGLGPPPPADDRPAAHAGQPHVAAGPAVRPQMDRGRSARQGPVRPAGADCAGRGRGHRGHRDHGVRAVADPWRGGAACHHRHAQAGAGAHHAPAGALLRLHQDRRARVADHVGRRGHPQSRRHRPRAAGGRVRDRRHGPGGAALAQLAPHADHDPGPRRLRRRHGLRVQHAAAALPRARQDQRRGDGPPHRSARRHPHREVVHGREARRDRVHEGRPPAVPQHRAVDDRRLGHERGRHRRHRRRRRADDLAWRTGGHCRRDDARRPHHLYLLHRHRRGAARRHRVDRHADHRGVCRPRPHPRNTRDVHRGAGGRAARGSGAARSARWPSTTCGSSTTPASRC